MQRIRRFYETYAQVIQCTLYLFSRGSRKIFDNSKIGDCELFQTHKVFVCKIRITCTLLLCAHIMISSIQLPSKSTKIFQ